MAHHASGSGNKGAHEREAARPEASSEIEEQPEYVRRARERVRPAAGSTVVYPDDSGITRPLDLPRTQWIILGAILAAAILFAAIWCVRTVGDVLNYEANTKQEVSQVIRRGVALDVVKLSDYVGKDSAAMQAEMAAAGLAIVDVTTVQANDTNAIDLVKLPSDMSAAEALLAYTKGVDEMPATEAAKFLSGSWRLTQQTSACAMPISPPTMPRRPSRTPSRCRASMRAPSSTRASTPRTTPTRQARRPSAMRPTPGK